MTGNLRDLPPPRSKRDRDPAGKAALFSSATAPPAAGATSADPVDGPDVTPLPAAAPPPAPAPALGSTVVIECGDCAEHTPISYASFAWAQLPIALWLPPVPGIHYNRRMTCPACSEWTWVRAHWLSPGQEITARH